ncbi:hypothetical protein LPJ55_002410 [Coemansia sp. RSA 990]|nr:hypothetical protein LPJ55_002410 [Coemansia sp. RSA 990]
MPAESSDVPKDQEQGDQISGEQTAEALQDTAAAEPDVAETTIEPPVADNQEAIIVEADPIADDSEDKNDDSGKHLVNAAEEKFSVAGLTCVVKRLHRLIMSSNFVEKSDVQADVVNANADQETDDKYNVSLGVENIACDTEDQLDELYLHEDKDDDLNDQASAEASQPEESALVHELQEPEKAPANDDSEAVLLASNLEDSMYRPESSGNIADEMHALEQSIESHASHEDEPEMVEVSESMAGIDTSREYVVTPSAYVGENEPEEVTYLRPESQAAKPAASDDAAEPAATSPADNNAKAETEDAVASVVANEVNAAAEAGDKAESSMAESYIHVSKYLDEKVTRETMTNREGSEQVERAVSEVMDNTKDAANKASDKARDASNKANKAAKDAADATGDAVDKASSRAKNMVDDASKNVKKAASNANSKAQDALSRAKESGERLAKRAMDEANEAEKALEREARETSPAVLRTLGVVAAALAVVSGYYFRLPGRDNQRMGFAGGVASAVIGLGTLATAFIKRNSS